MYAQLLKTFLLITVIFFGVSCAGLNQNTMQTKKGLKPAEIEKSQFEIPLSKEKKKRVMVTTSKGKLVIDLFEEQAPNTVREFLNLVEKDFYNNHSFDVKKDTGIAAVPMFSKIRPMEFKDEVNALSSKKGTVAVAKPIASSSLYLNLFYIALDPKPEWEDKFTIFGQVADGQDVLDKILPGDKITNIGIIEHSN
jgi:peptidyl-prolyl cis-trans isomerase B (cyclophilin B)